MDTLKQKEACSRPANSRRREDRRAESADDDPLYAATISEAMRLRPSPSPALRRLTVDTTIAGVRLPAGTVIAAPSPLLRMPR